MDAKLSFDDELLAGDLAVANGDLVPEQGLRTALLLSLFTDGRARDDDVLPFGQTDRRGWWGDSYAEAAGVEGADSFGSRLWLLSREKQTPQTLARAREMAREATVWLVTDGIARSVEVEARWGGPGRLDLTVRVQRPDADSEVYRFARLWESEQGGET
jgi:phage gp46-like protein